jgi:hypothetical protein
MNATRAIRTVFTEMGAVLENTVNGETFSVNLVGSTIWRHLSRGATRDEIVNQLCSQFGVTRNRICLDVDEFLLGLEQKGLLQTDIGNTRGPVRAPELSASVEQSVEKKSELR